MQDSLSAVRRRIEDLETLFPYLACPAVVGLHFLMEPRLRLIFSSKPNIRHGTSNQAEMRALKLPGPGTQRASSKRLDQSGCR
jgi:hypothetical protein